MDPGSREMEQGQFGQRTIRATASVG